MALSTGQVTRAQCDACPAIVYSEGGAQPKGLQVTARNIDGNGEETNVSVFACQLQHVGKAVANVLKRSKPAPAPAFTAAPGPTIQPERPVPSIPRSATG